MWNRSEEILRGVVEDELVLQDLADCASRYVWHLHVHGIVAVT